MTRVVAREPDHRLAAPGVTTASGGGGASETCTPSRAVAATGDRAFRPWPAPPRPLRAITHETGEVATTASDDGVPIEEGDVMRIDRNDIPVRIDAPGATARQQVDFGDPSGYGTLGAEFFSFGEGADLTPLLHGLEGDACQCPHWGYVIDGAVTAIYQDGQEETARTGDLFYWPPGHSVRAEARTDMVMFSPQRAHGEVMDHVLKKAGG